MGVDVVEWSRALDVRAKRMVLQCINGVSSNPVEVKNNNLTALKSNSYTVWFNFQAYIYIYNSVSSLKQQSTCRYVTMPRNITLLCMIFFL